jgi:hypothetical protein
MDIPPWSLHRKYISGAYKKPKKTVTLTKHKNEKYIIQ